MTRRVSARHARRSSSGPLYGALLALAIVGAGGVLAVMGGKEREVREVREAKEQQAARKSAGPKPFAEMPPEVSTFARDKETAGVRGKILAKAPDDLEKQPIWTQALAIAEAADSAYRHSMAGKRMGDRTAQNERGNEAEALYNEALEKTAAWEEELIARYGDGEPTVREITRTRSRWFEALDWLRKNSSR